MKAACLIDFYKLILTFYLYHWTHIHTVVLTLYKYSKKCIWVKIMVPLASVVQSDKRPPNQTPGLNFNPSPPLGPQLHLPAGSLYSLQRFSPIGGWWTVLFSGLAKNQCLKELSNKIPLRLTSLIQDVSTCFLALLHWSHWSGISSQIYETTLSVHFTSLKLWFHQWS